MTTDLVTIRNLYVHLGEKSILTGVSANLVSGRVTALIGLNGSGKTTLLRALLKEIPYSGEILFHCGHDHRQTSPQHVGYVPQKLRIDANMPLTVRDFLALALQRRPLFLGVSRRAAKMMLALLERVRVKEPLKLLDTLVEKLSGGELQRVLMGLALQPQPELLLLDEPAAGVDFQDQEQFYELIARLNVETGVTILLVSHDLSVVSRHAHHVICLKDGRIECEGTPREMLSGDRLQQTFGSAKGIYDHQHSNHEHRIK